MAHLDFHVANGFVIASNVPLATRFYAVDERIRTRLQSSFMTKPPPSTLEKYHDHAKKIVRECIPRSEFGPDTLPRLFLFSIIYVAATSVLQSLCARALWSCFYWVPCTAGWWLHWEPAPPDLLCLRWRHTQSAEHHSACLWGFASHQSNVLAWADASWANRRSSLDSTITLTLT